ncbi:unnamed protein product [Boreogadus saida]
MGTELSKGDPGNMGTELSKGDPGNMGTELSKAGRHPLFFCSSWGGRHGGAHERASNPDEPGPQGPHPGVHPDRG